MGENVPDKNNASIQRSARSNIFLGQIMNKMKWYNSNSLSSEKNRSVILCYTGEMTWYSELQLNHKILVYRDEAEDFFSLFTLSKHNMILPHKTISNVSVSSKILVVLKMLNMNFLKQWKTEDHGSCEKSTAHPVSI